MSNDTNRVLAEFDGEYLKEQDTFMLASIKGVYFVKADDLQYHESYDWLMPVWAKFRELNFEDNAVLEIQFLTNYRQCIRSLSRGTITDFYNALIKAVEWYNSTVKN